jgi:CRP-like cAMP-binding protein
MLASERQVAALVGLFKGGTKLTYRKGEFIIRPGETPSAVFYIETGLVKAYNITKYGEENLPFLHNHPAALPPLLDMVTEMYRIHSERLLNLEYRTVRERLVSFLLTMSTRFGKETKEGLVIEVPLRHQDIASSINASRETASREIAVLERKELIKNKNSFIILKDVPALQAFL